MAGIAGSSTLRLLYKALNLAVWVVFLDAVMSWIWRDPTTMPRAITSTLLAPLYAPIRSALHGFYSGRVDLSPVVVLLVLFGLRAAVRPRLGAPP